MAESWFGPGTCTGRVNSRLAVQAFRPRSNRQSPIASRQSPVTLGALSAFPHSVIIREAHLQTRFIFRTQSSVEIHQYGKAPISIGFEFLLTTAAQTTENSAFILAVLNALGGSIGYARTGSVPSITAGLGVGALVNTAS